MDDRERDDRTEREAADPPGEGESIEDASREAVRELQRRGRDGHAGAGDIG